MFQNRSVTINGKHSYYDYGLYVKNTVLVSPPEVRTQYIEIPGRDGSIDLTDALAGKPVYGSRTITIQLNGKKPPEEWAGFISDFLNDIHGKKVEITLDEDTDWYYTGRAAVESDYTLGETVGSFTVTVTAQPYKISRIDRLPVLTVSGSGRQRAIGSEMTVTPTFICSSAMTLTVGGKNYSLKVGENRFYDLVFENKAYDLTFVGNGTVEVRYQRGRL